MESSEDRISGMPDHILLHILSFLGMGRMADAFKTATVSRRWRDMWAHAPPLDFRNSGLDHLSLSSSFCHNFPRNLLEKGHSCSNIKKVELQSSALGAISILKLFPNLEDLTFSTCMSDNHNKIRDIGELPYCLRQSLKRITILDFRGSYSQIKLANYLAAHAMVLETMQLSDCEGRYALIMKEIDQLKERIASPYGQVIWT